MTTLKLPITKRFFFCLESDKVIQNKFNKTLVRTFGLIRPNFNIVK